MFIAPLLSLALIPTSQAGDVVVDITVGDDRPLAIPADAPEPLPAEVDDGQDDEGEEDDAEAEDRDPVTQVIVHDHDHDDEGLQLQYGMLFLPDAPAHPLVGKLVGEEDAYVSADLRYMPANDLLWTGRLGAGFDVLGGGGWDLTLGLFAGSAGEWDRNDERAILYSRPMGGTEIGLGVEGRRLFARYRWLAGLGTGPVDELLTENEFTVGYKVVDELSVYGQWLRVNPGEADKQGGIGLGVRAVF